MLRKQHLSKSYPSMLLKFIWSNTRDSNQTESRILDSSHPMPMPGKAFLFRCHPKHSFKLENQPSLKVEIKSEINGDISIAESGMDRNHFS